MLNVSALRGQSARVGATAVPRFLRFTGKAAPLFSALVGFHQDLLGQAADLQHASKTAYYTALEAITTQDEAKYDEVVGLEPGARMAAAKANLSQVARVHPAITNQTAGVPISSAARFHALVGAQAGSFAELKLLHGQLVRAPPGQELDDFASKAAYYRHLESITNQPRAKFDEVVLLPPAQRLAAAKANLSAASGQQDHAERRVPRPQGVDAAAFLASAQAAPAWQGVHRVLGDGAGTRAGLVEAIGSLIPSLSLGGEASAAVLVDAVDQALNALDGSQADRAENCASGSVKDRLEAAGVQRREWDFVLEGTRARKIFGTAVLHPCGIARACEAVGLMVPSSAALISRVEAWSRGAEGAATAAGSVEDKVAAAAAFEPSLVAKGRADPAMISIFRSAGLCCGPPRDGDEVAHAAAARCTTDMLRACSSFEAVQSCMPPGTGSAAVRAILGAITSHARALKRKLAFGPGVVPEMDIALDATSAEASTLLKVMQGCTSAYALLGAIQDAIEMQASPAMHLLCTAAVSYDATQESKVWHAIHGLTTAAISEAVETHPALAASDARLSRPAADLMRQGRFMEFFGHSEVRNLHSKLQAGEFSVLPWNAPAAASKCRRIWANIILPLHGFTLDPLFAVADELLAADLQDTSKIDTIFSTALQELGSQCERARMHGPASFAKPNHWATMEDGALPTRAQTLVDGLMAARFATAFVQSPAQAPKGPDATDQQRNKRLRDRRGKGQDKTPPGAPATIAAGDTQLWITKDREWATVPEGFIPGTSTQKDVYAMKDAFEVNHGCFWVAHRGKCNQASKCKICK